MSGIQTEEQALYPKQRNRYDVDIPKLYNEMGHKSTTGAKDKRLLVYPLDAASN